MTKRVFRALGGGPGLGLLMGLLAIIQTICLILIAWKH